MEQTGTTEEEMGKWEDRSMRGNKFNVSFMYVLDITLILLFNLRVLKPWVALCCVQGASLKDPYPHFPSQEAKVLGIFSLSRHRPSIFLPWLLWLAVGKLSLFWGPEGSWTRFDHGPHTLPSTLPNEQ